MKAVSAGCLCGEVRILVLAAPKRVGMCHCLRCRKHPGSLFYAAAMFDENSVETSGKKHIYHGRHFCPDCGSSVFARSEDEIEVHLGAFDEPDQFVPSYELWTCRKEAWFPTVPGIASFEHDTPKEAK